MIKTCSSCNKEKELSLFGLDKSKKDGKSIYCIECMRNKIYKSKNKLKVNLTNKKSYSKNRIKRLAYKKDYRQKNKNKIKEYQNSWNINNKSHIAEYYNEYRVKNKETLNLKRCVYNKERYIKNINSRLMIILRTRLNLAIKGNWKSGSAVRDLGCTIDELKLHLENQFTEGMTWNNWTRNGWHIDHIKPISSFNLENREEFLKAAHYTNLQPLWAKDNLSKGNKYEN